MRSNYSTEPWRPRQLTKRPLKIGAPLLTWINYNQPVSINNYINYKVWDEIINLFPNFNGSGYIVEVWEWIINFNQHFT